MKEQRYCPYCGMTLRLAGKDSFNVAWNDEKKEFEISLRMYFCSCGHKFPDNELKYLPIDIANKSSCACGRTLNLGDFRVAQEGNGFSLTAKYFCPVCGEKSVFEKIKMALYSFWRDTTKIEVSPSGVKYEKASK